MEKTVPRRVEDDTLVTVELKAVNGPMVPNTWFLVGVGIVERLTCKRFRQSLAFVNHVCDINMDESGEPVSIDDSLVLVGAIQMTKHTIDIGRRYCSCKSYKYRQTQHRDRNCKHLNSLCTPSYVVTYTKEPQDFQLISDVVPKKRSVYADWIFSQKHDGIRVRVRGTSAWTRGGMRIDLTGIWTPDDDIPYSYDAELCTLANVPSSHDQVLSCVLSGKIRSLRLCVFDIIDPTRTFGQRLMMLSEVQMPVENRVRYHMVNLRGSSLLTRLKNMNIGSTECEGVIIRNPSSYYDTSGRRSNRSIFKVKSRTLQNIQ